MPSLDTFSMPPPSMQVPPTQLDTATSMPAAHSNGAAANGNGVVSNGIAGLTNGSAAANGRPVLPPKSAAENRWAGVERPYSQVLPCPLHAPSHVSACQAGSHVQCCTVF